MIAWRIYKPKHARTAFTGRGAFLYGGRFNSNGVSVIYTSYTSESIALASLEMLVRLQNEEILEKYRVRRLMFDQQLVEVFNPRKLRRAWRTETYLRVVQQVGNDWVASARSAVLQVPSAVVPSESNFLLNPSHPDFPQIVIDRSESHVFDPRLGRTLHKP